MWKVAQIQVLSFFGKLLRSTAKGALAPTFTHTPSWPFSGTLFVLSACKDSERNQQSLGLPRNPQKTQSCQSLRKPMYSPLWKATTNDGQRCRLANFYTNIFLVIFGKSNHIFGLQRPWTKSPKLWLAKKFTGTQSCGSLRKAVYSFIRKLPGSTAKSAFAPTFKQTPSWLYSRLWKATTK